MSQATWDKYFIEMAMLVATKSKDPSTKVGCVIVGPDNEIRTTGFNGFPRGVQETVLSEVHCPVEYEYNIIARGYSVKCSCGVTVDIQPSADYIPLVALSSMYKSLAGMDKHFAQADEFVLSDRWQRPEKYDWVEHAERNAIYNAARIGVATGGCVAYINWEPYPCIPCARAFVQAGIFEVVGPSIPFSTTSKKDWKFDKSRTIMTEGEVKYRTVRWDETKR